MKNKKTKRGVGEAVILTAIVILVTIFFYLIPYFNITGLFISEKNLLSYDEKINLRLNESTSFEFNISPNVEEFELVSVALSGRFIGSGSGDIKIYLEDENKNSYLILDKEAILEKSISATGRFTEVEEIIEESNKDMEITKENETNETSNANATIDEKNIEQSENVTEENITEILNTTSITENTTTINASKEIQSNVAEENNTIPENATNASKEIKPENATEKIANITEEIHFENICLETCSLPKGLSGKTYKLVIHIENSTIELNKISYTIRNLTEKITVEPLLLDRKGNILDANIRFYKNNKTIAIVDNAEQTLLSSGTYSIEISVYNHTINKIYFHSAKLTEKIKKLAFLDSDYYTNNTVQGWAIKPVIDAESMDISVKAKGTKLYKCDDWDFKKQRCKQNFTAELLTVPEEIYTLNLPVTTLGFIEVNASAEATISSNVSVEKIYNDPEYEVFIDSIEYNNKSKTLTVIFHHNAKDKKRIYIEFENKNKTHDYQLDKKAAKSNENITLTVFNWTPDDYFEIKVGDRTEILGIGSVPQYVIDPAIKDAENRTINASIKILKTGREIAKAKTNEQLKVKRGIYNIEITPESGKIKKIKIEKADIKKNLQHLLKLDNVPKEKIPNAVSAFAIDPTELVFDKAIMTITASADTLWKCQNWNFETRECTGSWQKIADLIPGEEYTLIITPEDPGFAEGIKVINVQSYPTVGGNWTVAFTTIGTANLTITASNGTTWSNVNEEEDLKFLEIRCGEEIINYTWIGNNCSISEGCSVFIPNYSCENETSYEISKVLTTGAHHIKFEFGGQTAYAHNWAEQGAESGAGWWRDSFADENNISAKENITVSSGAVTLARDCPDGNFVLSSGTATLSGEKYYCDFNITGTATLYIASGSTLKIHAINIYIGPDAKISGYGRGYSGGAGGQTSNENGQSGSGPGSGGGGFGGEPGSEDAGGG
ncbi:hypothetical protein DRJ19_01080, partial [Candidatus Woesearchaeota archaeon]